MHPYIKMCLSISYKKADINDPLPKADRFALVEEDIGLLYNIIWESRRSTIFT